MKITPKANDEGMMPEPYSSEAMYPWGTKITLEDDLAVGAGYDKYKAGTVVEVRAKAFVTRKSESADLDDAAAGETEKCLSLQLTEINLSKASADYVKQLYATASPEEGND